MYAYQGGLKLRFPTTMPTRPAVGMDNRVVAKKRKCASRCTHTVESPPRRLGTASNAQVIIHLTRPILFEKDSYSPASCCSNDCITSASSYTCELGSFYCFAFENARPISASNSSHFGTCQP